MSIREIAAENFRADTINELESALESARRGYWAQCAERASIAAKSAARWENAADIWKAASAPVAAPEGAKT